MARAIVRTPNDFGCQPLSMTLPEGWCAQRGFFRAILGSVESGWEFSTGGLGEDLAVGEGFLEFSNFLLGDLGVVTVKYLKVGETREG